MPELPDVSGQVLAGWCVEHLGASPSKELFRGGYLSVAVGLVLDDQREIVMKVRPPSPRLQACVDVQRALWSRGFPCPKPLTDALDFNGHEATAEEYRPGGEQLPASGRDAEPFADALSELMAAAPSPAEVGTLRPAPPWTAWQHEDNGLWPWPDDFDGDLNMVGGPAWIDRAGEAARSRLAASSGPVVIGHGDWWTGNIRWQGNQLRVVHDWDSVTADHETALVGFAAAVYPTVRAGSEANLDETEAFITRYTARTGRPFSSEELECSWAAGVWLRAFDAKKQHAKGQPVRSLTETEAAERLRRAGI